VLGRVALHVSSQVVEVRTRYRPIWA
jgi:hypothetical protein